MSKKIVAKIIYKDICHTVENKYESFDNLYGYILNLLKYRDENVRSITIEIPPLKEEEWKFLKESFPCLEKKEIIKFIFKE